MKFSLLFEMQISEPSMKKEFEVFHQSVEQALLAETVGYDRIWVVEHHGLFEYSHSSAPELFLSFVAAKTKRIRLGHGVTLLPHRYNHPIRIAERIATLDILSEGRVDWGTGKSGSTVEQGAFECTPETLHEEWLEALQMIPQMWKQDVFEFQGKFFNIPPTQILPKPVQTPHPPIFAACTKPDSAVEVGRLGLGALNFSLGDEHSMKQKVTEYKKAATKAQEEKSLVNNHFVCAPNCLVLNDDLKACKFGLRGAQFFTEALSAYYLPGRRPTGLLDVPRDFLPDEAIEQVRAFRNQSGSPLNPILGDPTCVRETLSRFEETGVDELILVMQMGTVPHELVMESIRTFGEHVMPFFQ